MVNSKMTKITCKICRSDSFIYLSCLRRRTERRGEEICKTCYRKISRGGPYRKDYYPESLQDLLNEEYWDYDIVKPYLDSLKTKKKVRFICEKCGKKDIMSLHSMRRRKICGTRPICRKCSLKFATGSPEWRKNNSEAQFIAQNRPEVLEKQRQSQLRLMNSDPLYIDKRCSKSYISGKIRGFRFDSSWELYFIVYCWESEDVKSIERYNRYIDYYDSLGKKRRYHPDFLVCYKNGKSKIIEIKGSKKYNNFHEKFNSAKLKHGIGYVVYEEKDILKMGLNFRSEVFLSNFYKKYYHEIEFDDNEKVRKLKKRIDKWLK